MEHEAVHVWAVLSNDEGNPVCHQAADESYIPAETVELGDENRAFQLAGLGERPGKNWATVEGIKPFGRFDLFKILDDFKPVSGAKRRQASRWASSPRPERP